MVSDPPLKVEPTEIDIPIVEEVNKVVRIKTKKKKKKKLKKKVQNLEVQPDEPEK